MIIMTARSRLLNRRQSEALDLEHAGNLFIVSLSRFEDGRTAEFFISSARPGSSIEAIARDAAITASLAPQCGCEFGTLRRALTKDHDGIPATVLGSALAARDSL